MRGEQTCDKMTDDFVMMVRDRPSELGHDIKKRRTHDKAQRVLNDI